MIWLYSSHMTSLRYNAVLHLCGTSNVVGQRFFVYIEGFRGKGEGFTCSTAELHRHNRRRLDSNQRPGRLTVK